MGERNIVLDQPVVMNEQTEALRHATERADRLEAELAKLKGEKVAGPKTPGASSAKDQERLGEEENESISLDGLEELRKDSMMVHLLDSLEAGNDIGHYGRLVFVMVARHFLAPDEVLRYLSHDKDFSEEQALLMVRQVEERDYNPPKRERILEWQSQQDFPILPKHDDPDCGNVYRNLKFPTEIYEHISHYQEEKLSSGE